MEELSGIKISKLELNLEKLGDFLYQEGPLLSLFADKENPEMYYLYKWSDSNETLNRWLIFQTNTNALKKFFLKECSLKKLILNNAFVFVSDLDDELSQNQILISSTETLPESYLPSEKSFFNEEIYTPYASEFKNTLSENKVYHLLHHLQDEVTLIKKKQESIINLLALKAVS
jgi:hypothetical protein